MQASVRPWKLPEKAMTAERLVWIARDLDGVLHRLRPGGEEDGLLGRRPGGERVQLLGERDVALVRGHLEAGVGELLQLLRDGGLHLRVHVPGVEHRDAAGEVDVAAPLDVPDLGVAGALGVHRQRVGYAARYRLLATGVEFGVGRQGSSFGSGCCFADGCGASGTYRAPGGTKMWRPVRTIRPAPRGAHLPAGLGPPCGARADPLQ